MHAPWSVLRSSAAKREDNIDDEISWRRPDGFVRSFVRSGPFLRSTSHSRVPRLSILMPVSLSLSRAKRTNFPSRFRRFSPSLSVSLSRANISPSAASSSDRIEESSETAAISAEIESQNGENDCECFPTSKVEGVLKRERNGAEYRSGRKRRVIKKREKREGTDVKEREREKQGRTRYRHTL